MIAESYAGLVKVNIDILKQLIKPTQISGHSKPVCLKITIKYLWVEKLIQ